MSLEEQRVAPCLSLLAIALVLFGGAASGADRPPNIVFILADDLGYRELGSFGQKKIRTPHLDELAREGVRLTQHYAGNAVCAPSRCVLMTSKHPGHAYIRANKELQPEGQHPIPDNAITLAELLAAKGYATGGFGKWGLGGPGSSGEPLNQGFDRFFGYNCQRHAHSYYPNYLWSDRERVALANDPPVPGHARLPEGADPSDPRSYEQFKGDEYAPDRINEQALHFVREHKDQPFFLYYPTIIPHVALHVPDEELAQYLELGWNDPPFTGQSDRGYGYTPHFTPRAAYAAMITRMDRYVGNVLMLLDELQLNENTIVVFSSDNGTTSLTAEVDSDFFDSTGELRGLKGSLWEGGVRVPTIVRWTGRVDAGSASDRVSGFEDWMPTLLDLVGASELIPDDIDGISMAPTLLGEDQEPRPFLYREYPRSGGQQSIRIGKWKAIRPNLGDGEVETQLYNLEADPGELHNIAGQHPDVVQRLEDAMQQQHEPSELFPLHTVDKRRR